MVCHLSIWWIWWTLLIFCLASSDWSAHVTLLGQYLCF